MSSGSSVTGLSNYDCTFSQSHDALIVVGGTIDTKELVRLYVNGLH
jgi:hypothetical protein